MCTDPETTLHDLWRDGRTIRGAVDSLRRAHGLTLTYEQVRWAYVAMSHGRRPSAASLREQGVVS